jgi:uncharacterized membrane protein
MRNEIGNRSGGITRHELFSDGVFALAITLLILDIPVPDVKLADPRQHNDPFRPLIVSLERQVGIDRRVRGDRRSSSAP